MYSLKRQAVAIFLSAMLVGLPVFGSSPSGLVGVAQGTGAIRINGQPFGGQASLFSGDQVVTGAKSPLTVISSAAERFRFEPGTSAQVAKDGRAIVIRLNTGVIDLRTAGALRANLPNGVTVRPAASVTTLAQINRLANGTAEVAVYKGTMEVADASESVTVNAGHTAVIGPESSAQIDNQNQKNRKKKAWALFITTGLSAGAVAAILANEQSHSVSVIDP